MKNLGLQETKMAEEQRKKNKFMTKSRKWGKKVNKRKKQNDGKYSLKEHSLYCRLK